MSYGADKNAVKSDRFSLLLLEPGEIYFEDFRCFCFPLDGISQTRNIRGMLKICSKSLIFVPKIDKYPVLKILYRDTLEIKEWESPSKSFSKEESLIIETEQVVEMKQNNQITPYVFKRERQKFIFELEFSRTESCVPQMCQLLRAASLPIADQTAMINAIVQHRQHLVPFNKTWLESLYEDILVEVQCDKICPLVVNPGRVMITSERLYFQAFNNAEPLAVTKIKHTQVTQIIKRRFMLRNIGLEIFTSDSHLYLAFHTSQERDHIYEDLVKHVTLDDDNQHNMTWKWQNGVISNFEYLKYLNCLADRSINDFSQYPIFPWIITDFTSSKLDLSNKYVYRDLKKPIGALNQDRLTKLLDRYHDMPEPKFLYGSHYSTPGYVLYYIVRSEPEYMLCLQNGRFDQPDRMFNSLVDAWKNCYTSYSDFKELIPEFFSGDGSFLLNSQQVNFGMKQDGTMVGDVELPPWAKTPQEFVKQMREALESEYVTENLPHWIDLIFGYKQRGEEARQANNIFFYLTYEGEVNIDSAEDLNERTALEQQIMEFGQTPRQIFTLPHPVNLKHSALDVVTKEVKILTVDNNVQSNSASKTRPLYTCECCDKTSPQKTSESSFLCKNHLNCTKINSSTSTGSTSADNATMIQSDHLKVVPQSYFVKCLSCGNLPKTDFWTGLEKLKICSTNKLHKSVVTFVKWNHSGSVLYSGDEDGCLKMFSLEEKQQMQSVNISTLCLSDAVIWEDIDAVLVSCWDNFLYVYSFEYGKLLNSICAHDDAISCIQYNKKQEILLTGSWDSTIKIWNCQFANKKLGCEFKLKAQLDGDSGITSLCEKFENNVIISSSNDGHITVWNSEFLVPVLQEQVHTKQINALQVNADCTNVISVADDCSINITEIKTGIKIFSAAFDSPAKCVVWHNNKAVVGLENGEIQVWHLENGTVLDKVVTGNGCVMCLACYNSIGLAVTTTSGYITVCHKDD